MIEIGLTGGIGAGKSTVADGLVARGAVLIDADRIVRELQEPGTSVFEAMVERWGHKIVAADGSLDRAAVAGLVFGDDDELKALNEIVHPAVAEEMKRRREELSDSDSIVILDIPLLVRADGESVNDTYSNLAGIIVVDTDPEIAVARLMTHRGFDEKDARARIANQASREARLAVADLVVDNSSGMESLTAEVDRAWEWAQALRDQRREPEKDPEGRWGQLAVLSVAMVLSMAPWFSTAAVLPQLRDAWGLSSVSGSWLTIAVQIGFVIGAIVSALTNLADRMAPRRLILIGASVAAAANVMPAVVDAYGPTLIARLITGAALAAVYPPALKAMSTWFRVERGLALGAMVGALTVGSALPHLVNGIGGAGWRSVLVVTSIATFAGGVVADRLGRDGPFVYPSAPFEPRAVVRAFANRRVRLATLGYFGHMWELYAMWAWFGVFYVDVLTSNGDSDPTRHGALIAAAVIGIGGVGSLWAGRVSDRWSREVAAGVPMIVSGSVALVIGFLENSSPVLVAALGLLWGISVIADSAQFSTIVTESADQRFVGTSLTVQLASGFVLTVATIFFVPVIRDAWGWGAAFAFLAPGPLLGAIAMRALDRDRRRDLVETDVGVAR